MPIATVPAMAPKLQRAADVDEEAQARTQVIADRVRRLRTERALTQMDLAHMLHVDVRTIKAWEKLGWPQRVEATQSLVRNLELNQQNGSGRSARVLYVGPGVELLRTIEETLDVAEGTLTGGVYWPTDGATLEQRVVAEEGIDPGTKQSILTLIKHARERNKR